MPATESKPRVDGDKSEPKKADSPIKSFTDVAVQLGRPKPRGKPSSATKGKPSPASKRKGKGVSPKRPKTPGKNLERPSWNRANSAPPNKAAGLPSRNRNRNRTPTKSGAGKKRPSPKAKAKPKKLRSVANVKIKISPKTQTPLGLPNWSRATSAPGPSLRQKPKTQKITLQPKHVNISGFVETTAKKKSTVTKLHPPCIKIPSVPSDGDDTPLSPLRIPRLSPKLPDAPDFLDDLDDFVAVNLSSGQSGDVEIPIPGMLRSHSAPQMGNSELPEWGDVQSAPIEASDGSTLGNPVTKPTLKIKLRPSPVTIPNLQKPSPSDRLTEFSPDRVSPMSGIGHHLRPSPRSRFGRPASARDSYTGVASSGRQVQGSPIYGTGLLTPPSQRGVRNQGFTNKQATTLEQTICPGHSRPITGLSYTQVTEMGPLLLSSCLDKKPMYRYDNGDWIGTFIGHKGGVLCARANRSKQSHLAATMMVTGSLDYCARLWDARNGNCISIFKHHHIVKACDFVSDSKSFFTGGKEKKLRLFDCSSKEAKWKMKTEHEICQIVPSNDSNLVLTSSSESNVVTLWDIRTTSVAKRITLPDKVVSMQRNIKGKLLTLCSGKTVSFFDMDTFDETGTLCVERNGEKSKGGLLAMASTHPERGLCVTAQEGVTTVDVWDTTTKKHLANLRGHHGEVQAIAWDPSGRQFATGAKDAAIRLWKVAGSDLDIGQQPSCTVDYSGVFAQTPTEREHSPPLFPAPDSPPVGGMKLSSVAPEFVPSATTLNSDSKEFIPKAAQGSKSKSFNADAPEFIPGGSVPPTPQQTTLKTTVDPTAKEFVPSLHRDHDPPRKNAYEKSVSPDEEIVYPPPDSPLLASAPAFVPSSAPDTNTLKVAKKFIPKPTAAEFVPSPAAKPFVPSPAYKPSIVNLGPPAMPQSPPPGMAMPETPTPPPLDLMGETMYDSEENGMPVTGCPMSPPGSPSPVPLAA